MSMSGFEIFLIITGFIFIIISFFLIDKKSDKDIKKVALNADDVLSKEEMDQVIKKVQLSLDDIVSTYVIDTEESLNRITNEKIIAVNDFSEQLLAKLENNHQEVIFLYKMLQEKEEIMKSTLNRMEVVRKENQEFMDKIMELRNTKMKSKVAIADQEKVEKKRMIAEDSYSRYDKNPKKNINQASRIIPLHEETYITEADGTALKSKIQEDEIVIPEYVMRNKNDKILKLYKEKKSVKEISKLLGIGQGEVKLVIDLYAR